MGDLLLTIYVCTYVRTYVVRTYRKISLSQVMSPCSNIFFILFLIIIYLFTFTIYPFGWLFCIIQFKPACRCCFGCITFISLYSRKKDNSEDVTLRNVDRNVAGFLPAN